MIQFSLREGRRDFPVDACSPIDGPLFQPGPWGSALPVSMSEYAHAAKDAGLGPTAAFDSFTYKYVDDAYVFTFTFDDAEAYPALYSRNLAAFLSASLNPTNYGPLDRLNDQSRWDIQVSSIDVKSTATEIADRIRKENRRRSEIRFPFEA